jgi:lipopolysaccharide transport system ATP-binding protein
MSDLALTAEHISKIYKIGTNRSKSIKDAFSSFPKSIWLPRKEEKNEKYFSALNDISFEIKQGEAIGIIGKNGAGKSTLLKILSRITEPSKGTISINGRVSSLLEVGTGFHPELTGRENIYLNGAILGMKRKEIKSKFDEIVNFSGVEKFLDTPVKHYSSGMFVRLAFAVAAHLEPEILIIDEVLAVGDVEFQKKCLGKMEDATSKEGRTVLFVSHNMEAIRKICSRVIYLKSGEIVKGNLSIEESINRYNLGDNFSEYSTTWEKQDDDKGNPYFAPLSISICYENGDPASYAIKRDEKVFFILEGEVKTMDHALTIGFSLYNEEDNLLFWSYQTDDQEIKWPKLEKGINKIFCEIPVNILNEGKYRIELHGGLHNRQWLFQPAQERPFVSFEVKGNLSQSPYWNNKRPGILAPVLEWKKL